MKKDWTVVLAVIEIILNALGISYILTKRKHCNLTAMPADSKKPVCGMFAVSRFFVQSPKNDRRLQKNWK